MRKNISCGKVGMLCVWMLMVCVGVAAAGAGEFVWPAEWKAFGPIPPAGDMVSPGGTPAQEDLVPGEYFKTMPDHLRVNDADYSGQPIKLSDGALVEFGGIYPGTQRGDTVYLVASVAVEYSGKYHIHAGANWWMQWWVNGEPVFNTIPGGNRQAPIAIDNHVFPVELQAGENILAVAVIAGAGGFSLAAGGAHEVTAAAARAAAQRETFRGLHQQVWADIKSRRGTGLLVGGNIDFASARDMLAAALELAGDDTERAIARLDMADCKLNDVLWTDMESARVDYAVVLESAAPAEYRARAAIGVGETLAREGEYEAARDYFEWARTEYKISRTPALAAEAQFARARAFMLERNYDLALDEFTQLLAMDDVPTKMRLEAQALGAGIRILPGLRPDRPRMFFNAETWPAVKARALGAQNDAFNKLQKELVRIDAADIRPADWGMWAMSAAFVYRVTGDQVVFDKLKIMLRATLDGWMRGEGDSRYYSRAAYAAALDWVWNDLTEAERKVLACDFVRYAYSIYIREKIYGKLDHVGYYYLRNMFWYAGLAVLGTELDDVDYARAVSVLGQGHVHNWELWSNAVARAGNDGGSGAFAVGRLVYEYLETPTPVWTYMHCLSSAFGEEAPAAWVYLGITPHHVLRNMLGITPRPGIKHFGFGRDWRPRAGDISAALLYDHLAQFIHFFADTHPQEAGIARHLRERIAAESRPGAGQFPIYPFLLNLDDAPVAGIPAGMPLARNFERRGKVLMSSGFGTNDTYILFSSGGGEFIGGHRDAGHFSIYSRGFLALDTGTRAHAYRGSADMPTFYFADTIAHNCVLVRNPRRLVKWEGEELAHTGGQDRNREFAKPLAFETRPEYVYAATDLTPTYNTNECAHLVRQFVFLPPHHVVVFDRVTARQPEYEKIWLFHTANEPVLRGNTFHADQDQGRIFCRTLYPLDAVQEIVGGPGKEFWASGRNWGMPKNSPYMRQLDMATEDDVPEVQGRWRVEVRPGQAREMECFLHLIQTADQSVTEMCPAEIHQTDDAVTISFAADTRRYTVAFNKTGPIGGGLTIESGGESRVTHRFTDEIMPQSGLALDGVPVWASEYAVAIDLERLRKPGRLDELQNDTRSAAAINLAARIGCVGTPLAGMPPTESVAGAGMSCKGCVAGTGLRAALSDSTPGVVRRAIWAVGESGCGAAVDALIALLNHADGSLRAGAVTALSRIAAGGDPAALSGMIVALEDAPPVLRRQLVSGLGSAARSAAVAAVIKILRDDAEPEVRAAAAGALGQLDFDGTEPVAALIEALNDSDWRVRRQAGAALAAIGAPSVPDLIRLLGVADIVRQDMAVEILAGIGAPAYELLLPVLDAEQPRVRANAAGALYPPPGDQRALPALRRLAADQDAYLRRNAARALGRIGSAENVVLLETLLGDADPQVRAAAAQALRSYPVNDLPVMALVKGLTDEAAEVRGAVARTLGYARHPTALQPLIDALNDPAVEVRVAAAWALGEQGDQLAVLPLIEAMKDDQHAVGYAANDALYRITGHKVEIPLGWTGVTIRQYRKPIWDDWLAKNKIKLETGN